jgi:hypothetical protein
LPTLWRIPFPDDAISYLWDFRADGTIIEPDFTPPENGDEIRRWTSSDNVNQFLQQTVATMYPRWYASGQNNQPYVAFDGVNDWMSGVLLLTPTNTRELWLVVDPLVGDSVRFFFSFNVSVALCQGSVVGAPWTVGYYDHTAQRGHTPSTSGPQLLRWRFDPTAGLASIYRNGALIDTDTLVDHGPDTLASIGASSSGTVGYSACNIYQIRAYPALLGDIQAAAVAEQLRVRYALW